MATRVELSDFLAGTERRAYKKALFAVRDPDHALDIVQDAMIKLAENYADRPVAELGPIFARIVQNTIHDFFRRQKVRSAWVTLFSALSSNFDEADPLERIESETEGQTTESAADTVEREQIVRIVEEEISRLPARQREAFVLRYWEEFDVAETAATMKCSEGSVKTHCSRATQSLAKSLRARGVTL